MPTSTHRARVLVVDDDLACRVLAALLLEKEGHSPTAVASVDRALERIDDEGTDLVVTDLLMPGRSGLDLLIALLERGLSTPVIALTASDDVELVARALELGATTVIPKAATFELLGAATTAALNGMRSSRAA